MSWKTLKPNLTAFALIILATFVSGPLVGYLLGKNLDFAVVTNAIILGGELALGGLLLNFLCGKSPTNFWMLGFCCTIVFSSLFYLNAHSSYRIFTNGLVHDYIDAAWMGLNIGGAAGVGTMLIHGNDTPPTNS